MKKIYFLPGTMCDQRLWADLWFHIEKLAPGQYQFEHLSIPQLPSINDIVDDINYRIVDDECYLVGFSLGGYLAAACALQHPDKIKKLMLISNMLSVLPVQEMKERNRTINWLKKHGYSGIPLKRIQGLLHPSAYNNEDIANCIQAMDKTLGGDVLVHQLEVTTKRENLLLPLAQSNLNVRLCIGSDDSLVDVKMVKEVLNNSDNVELFIHEKTGHMFPLEQPKRLAELFVQWF